jgi:hypothetical protein
MPAARVDGAGTAALEEEQAHREAACKLSRHRERIDEHSRLSSMTRLARRAAMAMPCGAFRSPRPLACHDSNLDVFISF